MASSAVDAVDGGTIHHQHAGLGREQVEHPSGALDVTPHATARAMLAAAASSETSPSSSRADDFLRPLC